MRQRSCWKELKRTLPYPTIIDVPSREINDIYKKEDIIRLRYWPNLVHRGQEVLFGRRWWGEWVCGGHFEERVGGPDKVISRLLPVTRL